ncbi:MULTISPECIES: hypothetical protein [unclassified Frankia]|uniref:hypothetical protein n=2 Tax=Frankia TaxID=1854 RepID=UPI001EF3E010|nr:MULTISPECIES: hypothetical protein [unclassified Frankia]
MSMEPQLMSEPTAEQRLYAAVRFAGDDRSSVAEVAILFESAAAADDYALGCRWDDYLVGAIRFHLPPRACRVRWVA